MTTRWPPAPLTKEDGAIWTRVVNASGRCFTSRDAGLYHRCTLGADRRDADLMLRYMNSRAVEILLEDENGVVSDYIECPMPRFSP